MTRQQWKTIIIVNVVTAVLILSPFLPGPSFLAGATNMLFSAAQLATFFFLILIPVGIRDTIRQAQKPEKSIVPILIWTVSLVVVLLSIGGPLIARKVSRRMAMMRAEKIISATEKYRHDHYHYPDTLAALVPAYIDRIPKPWVMGIYSYEYTNKNDSFDLTFTQNFSMGFNFEVVTYNPMGKQEGDGETPELYDAGRDGWKYYIYD